MGRPFCQSHPPESGEQNKSFCVPTVRTVLPINQKHKSFLPFLGWAFRYVLVKDAMGMYIWLNVLMGV